MLTPTQFLYRAAMQSRETQTPSGKTVTYCPIEHGPLSGSCFLCGAENVTGYPVEQVIKATFTDANLAKAPWSNMVCDACTWAISYRELRNYSIVATEDVLLHPSRQELRDILISPPTPPFLICVAESGQKWLHYKSAIAYSRELFPVRFEDLMVYVRPTQFASLIEIVENILQVFTKSEVMTGNYQVQKIQKYGLSEFERAEESLMRVRKSALFRLALYLASVPERGGKK